MDDKELIETLSGHFHACYHPVGTEAGRAALAANEQAGVTAAGLHLDSALEEVS